VVEGARLESEAGETHQATPKRPKACAIRNLALQNDHSVCVRKPVFVGVLGLTYHSPITIPPFT
jgi:hypothetical protein